MKKLITVLLILSMIMPAAALADSDPIVGAWYIMLDYRESPVPDYTGKSYMLYIMIFEEDGAISGISGEHLATGLYASGSTIGSWKKENGKYSVNVVGVAPGYAEFSENRLLVQMTTNVWYSMQRMNMGDWDKEMVIRY